MSWDIWLAVEVDGKEVEIADGEGYTHNCNNMVRAAGFVEWPYEVDGMTSREFCEKLDAALQALRANPAWFRRMNPENGWGDYDGLVRILDRVLDSFDRFPSATVRVSA